MNILIYFTYVNFFRILLKDWGATPKNEARYFKGILWSSSGWLFNNFL